MQSEATTALLDIRLGCEFRYETAAGAEFLIVVEPRYTVGPTRCLRSNRAVEPALPVRDYTDSAGNHCWRITADGESLAFRYDATFSVPAVPDIVTATAVQDPVPELPDRVLVYTLPSRYCQSDLLVDEAWRLFGDVTPGYARVRAICDWVHANIEYCPDSAGPTVSAVDTYESLHGVCRDLAHLPVAFCRALNIPARYVFGYLPDYAVVAPDVPMDFHAWFEAYLGGHWYTFDARHNIPRIGRVKIAHGRDAADVAMVTSFGWAQLQSMTVWTEARPASEAPNGLSDVEP
jgi:transglutaminase-like putative cysteine protease